MYRLLHYSTAGLCILGSLAAGCGGPQPDATVFAAASVADTVELLAEQFKTETGHSIAVSAAASSVLAQQIDAGADAAVFLSASVEWAEYLEARDLVAERTDLLGNQLVLIVPKDGGGIESPDDLRNPNVQRIAVADTDSVPAGRYAKHALTALGLWDALEGKLMPGADVRQALVYVERGEADAGLVYATDAAASENVRVVYAFSEDVAGAIAYPLVLTKPGAQSEAGRAFFAYLQSPAARDVFESRGFQRRGGRDLECGGLPPLYLSEACFALIL